MVLQLLMDLLYELRMTYEWIWSAVGVAVDRINSKYLERSVAQLKEFPPQNKHDTTEIDPGPLPYEVRLSWQKRTELLTHQNNVQCQVL